MDTAAIRRSFDGRITLKSLRIIQSNSEETLCYSATIYLDGKRIATGRNRGHGGPDMIDPTGKPGTAARKAYDTFLAEITAAWATASDASRYHEPMAELVGRAITRVEDEKATRTKIIFRGPTDSEYTAQEIKWPAQAANWRVPSMRAAAKATVVAYGIKAGWFTATDKVTFKNDEVADRLAR